MTNSSTGGYLAPVTPQVFPKNLTLSQFIQTVLAGLSGLDGTLVRPKWQVDPPKQPDLGVNWLAFGINSITPDANAYTATQPDESYLSIRHERIEVGCSFYGPQALELSAIVRDGFQLQQNLAALGAAKMGYTEVSPAQHLPDLVNERFINRVEMSVYLTRMVQRDYPVLTFVSSGGVIIAENQGDQNTTINFST